MPSCKLLVCSQELWNKEVLQKLTERGSWWV
uniref:Uncharacterized protein n=1 Tax=Rhizophora mucronata TaxID=61149 RepID=A0A2P2PJ73_RHIMU